MVPPLDSSKPRALVFVLVLLAGCTLAGRALAINSPTNFTASVSLCSSNLMGVRATWTDNATNETYYSLWGWQGGSLVELGRADPNSTSGHFIDVPVGAGTVNRYWLYAYNTNEGYSTGVSFDVTIPNAATAAPSGLAFSFPQTNNLRLTWTDNSTQEAYYEIAARDVTAGGSFVNLVVP
ncbi:MAG: hypothetical protein JNG86_14910, partial [Verrucomicrobiaceae bacterium]|nr:hypothetical protein [Verrucomicrobiaceae bacterium]